MRFTLYSWKKKIVWLLFPWKVEWFVCICWWSFCQSENKIFKINLQFKIRPRIKTIHAGNCDWNSIYGTLWKLIVLRVCLTNRRMEIDLFWLSMCLVHRTSESHNEYDWRLHTWIEIKEHYSAYQNKIQAIKTLSKSYISNIPKMPLKWVRMPTAFRTNNLW